MANEARVATPRRNDSRDVGDGADQRLLALCVPRRRPAAAVALEQGEAHREQARHTHGSEGNISIIDYSHRAQESAVMTVGQRFDELRSGEDEAVHDCCNLLFCVPVLF